MRSTRSASNTAGANDDIVIPEGVNATTVRLPTEVYTGDFGYDRATLPLVVVGVGDTRLDGETRNSGAVQPSLNSAIGTQVVFEAFPGTGGKGNGAGNTIGGEVGKGGIVGLAVVHQNFALATNAKILIRAFGGIRHGDKGDVVSAKGRGGFAGR